MNIPAACDIGRVTDPWLTTASGRRFPLLRPTAADVDVNDIAHALGQLCRFTGHTHRFYTVAEHCVLVALILREQGYDAGVQLLGLLHDAAEAYIGDVSSPLKWAMGELGGIEPLREVESRVNDAIFAKFALPWVSSDAAVVKQADIIAGITEARDLVGKIQYPTDLQPYRMHVEIAMLWAQWLYTSDLSVELSPRDLYLAVFKKLVREAFTVAP